MSNQEEILAAAELLRGHGIMLAIPGDYYVSPALATLYATDQGACYAQLEGGSRESEADAVAAAG